MFPNSVQFKRLSVGLSCLVRQLNQSVKAFIRITLRLTERTRVPEMRNSQYNEARHLAMLFQCVYERGKNQHACRYVLEIVGIKSFNCFNMLGRGRANGSPYCYQDPTWTRNNNYFLKWNVIVLLAASYKLKRKL